MVNVTKIGKFFNTPKRQALLKKMVQEYLPASRHSTLLDVCRTRWIQRIDGLERFLKMYEPISTALKIMSEKMLIETGIAHPLMPLLFSQ